MSAAYTPSRFQIPRSAKIVVQLSVSVTRALKRILRAAAIARSANCRRPSSGISIFSLNFCSIAKVGEAVSFLREMKLHASLIANLRKVRRTRSIGLAGLWSLRNKYNHVGADLCFCPGLATFGAGAETQVCPYVVALFIQRPSAGRLRLANQLRDLLSPVFKAEPVAVSVAAQINIAVFNDYPQPLV